MRETAPLEISTKAANAITSLFSRAVPEEERDPVKALKKLDLDTAVLAVVAPLLEQVGYALSSEDVVSRSGDIRKVTVARKDGGMVYLLSVPDWLLDQADDANRAAFSGVGYLFAKNSRLYVVSEDLSSTDPAFELMMTEEWAEMKGITAIFVPWRWLVDANKAANPQVRLTYINRAFKLTETKLGVPAVAANGGGNNGGGAAPDAAAPPGGGAAAAPAPAPVTPARPAVAPAPAPLVIPVNLNLQAKHIDEVVRILVKQANTPLTGTVQDYFRELVLAAHVPEDNRQQFAGDFTGNARRNARFLMDWAVKQQENPDDPRFTILGGLIRAMLDQSLPQEDARVLVGILNGYGLVLDDPTRDDINTRYMLPGPAGRMLAAAADYGPDFAWQGPQDGLELQSFLRPDPPWLDVGFLQLAMRRSAAVCRVEIGARKGTGFLVGATALLTNFHVLKERDDEDLAANAANAVLRFGCFSTEANDPSDGRVFRPAPNPILAQSPTGEHDFVLLRVENGIRGVEAIKPAPIDPALPPQGSALNIIHHPGGDTMKLSLSGNGITGVYTDRGLLQYVTRAAEGSSGSPCFNDDWRVVGLHRAQRSKPFGTVREGVLIGAIHAQIQPYL
jgi:hypothetical protein